MQKCVVCEQVKHEFQSKMMNWNYRFILLPACVLIFIPLYFMLSIQFLQLTLLTLLSCARYVIHLLLFFVLFCFVDSEPRKFTPFVPVCIQMACHKAVMVNIDHYAWVSVEVFHVNMIFFSNFFFCLFRNA